jgi:hypothetical protein
METVYDPVRFDWMRTVPDAGMIKYKNKTIYEHDGNKWRALCKTCNEFAISSKGMCRHHKGVSGASKASCIFIDKLSKELGIHIQHLHFENDIWSGSEREIENTNFKSDGYFEQNGKKVIIEFLGDYYHGNPNVYSPDTFNKLCKKTMGDLFMWTFQRFKLISEQGYNIFYVWESDSKAGGSELLKCYRKPT